MVQRNPGHSRQNNCHQPVVNQRPKHARRKRKGRVLQSKTGPGAGGKWRGSAESRPRMVSVDCAVGVDRTWRNKGTSFRRLITKMCPPLPPTPTPTPHPAPTLSPELHPRHGQQLHLTVTLGHIGGEGGTAYGGSGNVMSHQGLADDGKTGPVPPAACGLPPRMSLEIVFKG